MRHRLYPASAGGGLAKPDPRCSGVFASLDEGGAGLGSPPGLCAARAVRVRGFTLIELLVAISIMALVAILSWRGLDGMARAQASSLARADQVLGLQAGLGQWGADLDAMQTIPQTLALDWDGAVLRITRRSSQADDAGPRVVAWALRSGSWQRWQSAPLGSRGAWQQAWGRAARWGRSPDAANVANVAGQDDAVDVVPLADWQLFYFRANAWVPADGAGSAPSNTPPNTPTPTPTPTPNLLPPDGVRLVLNLPAGHPLAGRIRRDWIRPTLSGNKQ